MLICLSDPIVSISSVGTVSVIPALSEAEYHHEQRIQEEQSEGKKIAVTEGSGKLYTKKHNVDTRYHGTET